MAQLSHTQGSWKENSSKKEIKDEVPVLELVPVKMPFSEMTNDMKKEEVKNGPPFYIVNVFDGSPSVKAYVELAKGIGENLAKYFSPYEGFGVSTEYLPNIASSPVGDRDYYNWYFGRLVFADLNNCSIILYGDADPGGGGTFEQGENGYHLDYIIRELVEKNIKVYFVYLEDRKQEKKEYGHVEEAVRHAQDNLQAAKKKGHVNLSIYDKDDSGKKTITGNARKTVEECESSLESAKRREVSIKERKEIMRKLCEGTGGELIVVPDEELVQIRKGSKQAKDKSAYEIESRVLNVIIQEQAETGDGALK